MLPEGGGTIIFTGATSIGRHVMKAAAENLVPVTLELGGKSPVILGRSADLATSAARIMTKYFNCSRRSRPRIKPIVQASAWRWPRRLWKATGERSG